MSAVSSPMGLLIAREVRERTRTTAYKVTTVLLVLGAVLGIAVPNLISGDDEAPTVRIAVAADVPAATTTAIERLTLRDGDDEIRLEVRKADDVAAASDQVAAGDLQVLVQPERLVIGRGDDSSATGQTVAAIAEVVRLRTGLASIGVSGDDAQKVAEAPAPDLVQVSGSGDSPTDRSQFGLALVASIVLYMLLIFYGQLVAGGVNEEKSSRVVELLLATVPPTQLLTAKVTGIGLVGLLQVVLAAVAGGVAALATGASVPDGSAVTVAGYLVWFALGYALYCTLFAAAGALTSRPEDAQQAATPLYLLLGLGYGAVFAAVGNPDGAFATVLSFVPFTAPLVMPVRAAIGTVAPWQVGASMALCALTTYVGLRLAARVYAGALLRFGERVKVRQALRRT